MDYSCFTDEKLRQRMTQCLTEGHITNKPTASNMNLDPDSISGPLFNLPPPWSPTCSIQSRLSLLTHTQTEHVCSLGIRHMACGLLLFPPYHVTPFIQNVWNRQMYRKQVGGRRVAPPGTRKALTQLLWASWLDKGLFPFPTYPLLGPGLSQRNEEFCSYEVIWRNVPFNQRQNSTEGGNSAEVHC